MRRSGNHSELLFAGRAWIDALDPLFAKLSDAYMKILIEDFGTDHIYAADGAPTPVADLSLFWCSPACAILVATSRRWMPSCWRWILAGTFSHAAAPWMSAAEARDAEAALQHAPPPPPGAHTGVCDTRGVRA